MSRAGGKMSKRGGGKLAAAAAATAAGGNGGAASASLLLAGGAAGGGNRKLPPSHPIEQNPEHRASLMRSLGRNDVDLAALHELNWSLRQVRQALIKSCGELVLLELGRGTYKLGPNDDTLVRADTADEAGNEDGSKTKKDATTSGEEKGGEGCKGGADGAENGNLDNINNDDAGGVDDVLTKEQQHLCVDFLLRMALRRKLLNRLARRLHRLAAKMDGNEVNPPAAPRYGDLRLHVDAQSVQAHALQWQRQEVARLALDRQREEYVYKQPQEEDEGEEEPAEERTEGSESNEQPKSDGANQRDEEAKAEAKPAEESAKSTTAGAAASGNAPEAGTSKPPTADSVSVTTAPGTANTTNTKSQTPKEQPQTHANGASDGPTATKETAGVGAAAANAPPNVTSAVSETEYSVAGTANNIDYDAFKDFDDAYEKRIRGNVVTYTVLEEKGAPDGGDYSKIRSGAGIGATNRMSEKEKEKEFLKWTKALLQKIPDQPTFGELNMDHRVFYLEKRLKRARERGEELRREREEADEEEQPKKKPKQEEDEAEKNRNSVEADSQHGTDVEDEVMEEAEKGEDQQGESKEDVGIANQTIDEEVDAAKKDQQIEAKTAGNVNDETRNMKAGDVEMKDHHDEANQNSGGTAETDAVSKPVEGAVDAEAKEGHQDEPKKDNGNGAVEVDAVAETEKETYDDVKNDDPRCEAKKKSVDVSDGTQEEATEVQEGVAKEGIQQDEAKIDSGKANDKTHAAANNKEGQKADVAAREVNQEGVAAGGTDEATRKEEEAVIEPAISQGDEKNASATMYEGSAEDEKNAGSANLEGGGDVNMQAEDKKTDGNESDGKVPEGSGDKDGEKMDVDGEDGTAEEEVRAGEASVGEKETSGTDTKDGNKVGEKKDAIDEKRDADVTASGEKEGSDKAMDIDLDDVKGIEKEEKIDRDHEAQKAKKDGSDGSKMESDSEKADDDGEGSDEQKYASKEESEVEKPKHDDYGKESDEQKDASKEESEDEKPMCDDDGKGSDEPRDTGKEDAKDPVPPKKEDQEKPVIKRAKPISLAAVPSFYDQDLKRIRAVHTDLMLASIQEHARRRLEEVTRSYNNALRASTELNARREQIEINMQKIGYQIRHQWNDYKVKAAVVKNDWIKGRQQFDYDKLNSLLPSRLGRQPVGTTRTQQFGTRPDSAGISRTVSHALADIVDAVESVAHGRVSNPKYNVPPPKDDALLSQIQALQRAEANLQAELRMVNGKLQQSEDERSRTWKKLAKTKGEYEPHHRTSNVNYGTSRSTVSRVSTGSHHAGPVPNLRQSLAERVPTSSRSTVPSYVPSPRSKEEAVASSATATQARSSTGGGGGGGTSGSGGRPPSESKYSAARVRERIAADGTVKPVSEPKKGPDGLYLRPAGRTRKGMEWDAVRGCWYPAPEH